MTQNDKNPPDIKFAHASEEEFARILDYYEVQWEYEPKTFELRWDENGNVLEAFSPDFYLPEQDMYIELTTMEQRLITKKHRKLRKLRELHPDISIKLLNRSDFKQMMFKYGVDDQSLMGQKANLQNQKNSKS